MEVLGGGGGVGWRCRVEVFGGYVGWRCRLEVLGGDVG